MRNLDVGALTSVFELLQQHYPERLSQLWFLNAPWIFWGLWKVVKPFIHEATRQKIVFLSGPEKQRMLDEHIPAHVGARAVIRIVIASISQGCWSESWLCLGRFWESSACLMSTLLTHVGARAVIQTVIASIRQG